MAAVEEEEIDDGCNITREHVELLTRYHTYRIRISSPRRDPFIKAAYEKCILYNIISIKCFCMLFIKMNGVVLVALFKGRSKKEEEKTS